MDHLAFSYQTLLILLNNIIQVVELSMDGTSGALYAIFLNALAHGLRQNSPSSPQPVTPCPASEITQMLKDGTDGTGEGTTSLVAALAEADCTDVSRYYKAARIYNSGSIDVSGLLQDGVATHCYASDVANLEESSIVAKPQGMV